MRGVSFVGIVLMHATSVAWADPALERLGARVLLAAREDRCASARTMLDEIGRSDATYRDELARDPAVARCLPTVDDQPPARVHGHDFHTMDHQTSATTISASVGYEVWDRPWAACVIDNITGVTSFELAGQYVTRWGPGAYVTLPAAITSTEREAGCSEQDTRGEAAIGNLELGGSYHRSFTPSVDVVFHIGVALPTNSSDAYSSAGAWGNLSASQLRYSDLALRLPGTSWLRLGLSQLGNVDRYFWRVDVGIDLRLDTAYDQYRILRGDVGIGVDLGVADLTAELVTGYTSRSQGGRYILDALSATFAFGGRFHPWSAGVEPGLAVVLPLSFDGGYNPAMDIGAVASVIARLP